MSTLIPAALVAALWTWGIYAFVTGWREEQRAREALLLADLRAERQERVNKFAADTRAAFEAQMANRPHIAAMRARQEAEAFDPDAVDWTQRSGR